MLIRCDGGGTSRNDLVGQVIRDDAHRLPLDRLSSDSSLDKLRRLLGTDWSWGIPGSVVTGGAGMWAKVSTDTRDAIIIFKTTSSMAIRTPGIFRRLFHWQTSRTEPRQFHLLALTASEPGKH